MCNQEWIVTKLGQKHKALRSEEMVAVDCEMVLCEDGTEALVKVCVVDCNLQVLVGNFLSTFNFYLIIYKHIWVS